MAKNENIRYLPPHEIDKIRWDKCIEHAANGLIYAYSFYLDTMSENWDALVLDDYVAVMPLTWNKKWGIRYLYQPFLTAQLGVFGNGLTENIQKKFLNAIPATFKYIDICLNSGNNFSVKAGMLRNNFTLNLNRSYEAIFNNYKENTKRNIKKAWQAGCTFQKGFEVEMVITLAVSQMKEYGHVIDENIERFRKLYHLLRQKKMADTFGIFLNGSLLASCVLFFSHNRAYYILVGNNSAGKAIGASHALIDALIKDNAGKNLIFDFEGSDIPGLALFYQGFGALNEPYQAIRLNRLPFWIKWIKQ